MHRMLSVKSRARAQDYVEYGVLVGVVVIAFLIGLNVLMGGATTFLAHAEPTPNATSLAGLPNHVVTMTLNCSPPPAPDYTGTPFGCSVSVTDITTIEPARLPTGQVALSSSVGGTFNPGPCTLSGSGVTSTCSFQYTPTNFGNQYITATYLPTSSHQSRTLPTPAAPGQLVGVAVDQTATRLACVSSVPVGEPSQCNAQVVDLYPARAGPLQNLNVDVSTAGSGTFSDDGVLTPTFSGSYSPCTTNNPLTTDGTPACTSLFRSDVVPGEVGAKHAIVASFAGIKDQYDASDTTKAPPVVITIAGPSPHPVKVKVQCDDGARPQNPLRMDQTTSTTCTASVRDTNKDSPAYQTVGTNPTGITPTGTITWGWSADSGGAGSLSSNSCNLGQVTADTAECSVTYTPTSVGSPSGPKYVGQHIVTATYQGDWIHPDAGDQGSRKVYVTDEHPVQVGVTCTTGTLRSMPLLIQGASADSTACTVTVADTTNRAVTPTGTVSWGVSGNGGATGAFAPSTPCTLQKVDNATAWCQPAVSYQPTVRGTPDAGFTDQESTHTIFATYIGDWLHPNINNDLQGSALVVVGNFHPAKVTVACSPPTTRAAPLLLGPPATTTACTLTVVDTTVPSGTDSPMTPTGNIAWSMVPVGGGGTGTFAPSTSCALKSVNGTTAACPAAATYQPTAVGTPDGPDGDNTHQVEASYTGTGLFQNSSPEVGTTPVYVHN